MSGSLSQLDLVVDLKASLHDLAAIFSKEPADAAYIRHLDQAALDMHRVRPRRLQGTITLVALQHYYAAPADMLRVIQVLYADQERNSLRPWDTGYAHNIPRAEAQYTGDTPMLWLSPAPTSSMIAVCGASYGFLYSARHQVATDAEDTTIRAVDRHLLLLRAQAEAMKEAAARNISKPIAVTDTISSVTRNGVPAALYDQLLKEFLKAA